MAISDLFTDAAVIREAGEVVLYGAGMTGRDVCRVLMGAGVRIRYILDRRARADDQFLGVPIRSLEEGLVESARDAAPPLVLTIFNREVDIPALASTLRSAGFMRIVSFIDFHAAYAETLGDRFWLTDRRHLESHRADIAEAERLWTDDGSRSLYRGLVALRSRGEYSSEVTPCAQDTQYFPRDVPGWLTRRPLRFVDCGAYQGDTFELMLRLGLQAEASAHFEPDMDNFAKLARLVRARRQDLWGSALLWPCAVSDRSGLVKFRDGLQEGSGVSPTGGTTATAVSLDDSLAGWNPTFIKMDIEGSEELALHGARGLMADNRPFLPVCVYHRPDHLWRIPLLLSSWPELSGYRYYLRAHGFNGFDTVLYASPDFKRGES